MLTPIARTPLQRNDTSSQLSRRRFLGLSAGALGALGAGSVLGACSSSPSTSDTKQSASKTIKVMSPFALDPAIKLRFKTMGTDKLGFNLEWKAQTQDNIISQVLAAAQNGSPPDIIVWSSGFLSTVLAAGVPLLALEGYVAQQEKGVFYDQDREAALINGKQYAVGFDVEPRGLAYRKDIAQKVGATVPEAWTFDEFVDWATKMSTGGLAGFAFEAQQGDVRFPSNFLPLLWSTGADLVVRDGKGWKIGFQQAQMEEVMAFYNNIVQAKAAPKDVVTWGYAKTDAGLVKGVIASYSTGPFEQYQLVQFPKIREVIGVAPLPNAGTPTNYWEESIVMIHSGSKNQDNAWKLIDHLRSAAIQKTLVESSKNSLSPRKDVNSEIADPWLQQFSKVLPQSKVPEPIDSFAIFSKAIGPAMGDMLANGKSPADATKELMQKMQSVLPELS